MQTNQKGLDLIKQFEGCKLWAYKCPAGILTIGYGHTGPDVDEGLKITQAQADALLAKDLARFEAGVSKLVTADLSSNQFSALVAFAFNVGLANLGASTLLKLVNQGKDPSGEFIKWNHAGGAVLAGLSARRQAEAALYKEPV